MRSDNLISKSDREILFILYDQVDDIANSLKQLKVDADEVALSHAELRKEVYGNGGTGLSERHNSLKLEVSNIRAFLAWGLGGIGLMVGLLLFEIFIGRVELIFK